MQYTTKKVDDPMVSATIESRIEALGAYLGVSKQQYIAYARTRSCKTKSQLSHVS